jgi:hypothetical protein
MIFLQKDCIEKYFLVVHFCYKNLSLSYYRGIFMAEWQINPFKIINFSHSENLKI